MSKLRRFIIRLIAKTCYHKTGSHSWQHIEDVLYRARLIKRAPLTDCEYAAILFHDSSLMTGPRETHAEDSAVIAGRKLKWFFSNQDLELITNAIRRHRASFKGLRRTFMDDLLAAADRDAPCLSRIVKRLYQYRIEGGWDEADIPADVIRHLRDKYARNGYAFANIPISYIETYGNELKRMWNQIDTLDSETVRQMIAA